MVYENIPTTIMLFCIVVIVKLSRSQQACDSGWFGEKCRFMCHCLKSPTCDMNGDCPSEDRCANGFFGPGCQYVDLAVRSANDTIEDLIDEDEGTCNNNKAATSVRLSWIEGVMFSWLRIFVSNSTDNLHNVTVTLNNNVDCPNKKTFNVSSTAVDVACDFLSKVFTLDVVGAMAANICSIYISGGRNMALRQPANQTSTYFNDSVSNASNAVDGNRNPVLEEGHCTHTRREPVMAEWTLMFSRPCIIFEIILYNRETNRHRLGNFTLLTYNEVDQLVFSYNEKRDPELLSYDIQPPSRESLAIITIRMTVGEKMLTLCEVETFGEVVCPDEYYGLSCEKKCACQDREECFTVTGACKPGCRHGRYGNNCSKKCDSNCRHLECSQRTGACLTCNTGFRGPDCFSTCKFGTYGNNCEKNCSKNCQAICDISDGFCECKKPYVGKTCSDCPPKFYGDLCSEPCSKFCYNETCDANSGACFPCSHDHTGPKCTDAPTSLSVIYLFVAVGVCALISIVGICFFLRKTDRVGGGEAERNVRNDTVQDHES